MIDLKNCSIFIRDAGSNEIEIKIGAGNFQWTESMEREYILDRGNLDTVRDGDQTPMDVSFECTYEYLEAESGSDATVKEALKQQGQAATWVSSAADLCEPYAVDLVVIHDPSCTTSMTEETLFPDFRVESVAHDTKAGTLSISGKCNAIEPTTTLRADSNAA